MLHVNENIDDLFRKAAEEYPLRTDPPHWDEMKARLEIATPTQTAGKRGFHIFFPFLLLPFLFLPLILVDFQIRPPLATVFTSASHLNNQFIQTPIQELSTKSEIQKIGSGELDNWKSNPKYFDKDGRHLNLQENDGATYADNSNLAFDEYNGVVAISLSKNREKMESWGDHFLILPGINSQQRGHSENALNNPSINYSANLKEENQKKLSKHFYLGIQAGPDITMIKTQSVDKIGYGMGLVAGYRINQRWSIESGLIWQKKFYETDGEYFSTKNINLPSNVEIEYVDGNCEMMEIPLLANYTFPKKHKTGFLIQAGLSSYIMTKETYQYSLLHNGNQYPKNYTYSTNENYPFACMKISPGFIWSLSPSFEFRLSPYLQFPIKKMGTGELPLQSTGLNISLIKDFF